MKIILIIFEFLKTRKIIRKFFIIFNFFSDAGFHVCQTDTELYYDAYDPNGTSVFTIAKINEWVSLWPGLGNHLIFGSPEFKCGCFLGCDRFFVEGIGLHVDFCCSDYQETCVNRKKISSSKNFLIFFSSAKCE